MFVAWLQIRLEVFFAIYFKSGGKGSLNQGKVWRDPRQEFSILKEMCQDCQFRFIFLNGWSSIFSFDDSSGGRGDHIVAIILI
jgi:hypothetical protein